LTDEKNRAVLQEIQDRLFTIGSSLACDPEKEPRMKIPDLEEKDIVFLESEIDRMNGALPTMKNFILPGGHPATSQLHIARCVCRRAERCCVRMEAEGMTTEAIIIKYLNRLSDHLFMLARFTSQQLGVEEIPWKPRL
jgi:cob(I)alamin adenosyltransferase